MSITIYQKYKHYFRNYYNIYYHKNKKRLLKRSAELYKIRNGYKDTDYKICEYCNKKYYRFQFKKNFNRAKHCNKRMCYLAFWRGKHKKNYIKSEREVIKEKLKINKKTEEILLGSLLGDGHLRIQKNAKNAGYEELKLKESYLDWKIKNMKLLLKKSFKKRNKLFAIASPNLKQLNFYHKLFYKNGRKRISKTTYNYLRKRITPLCLAVWYMDDGNLSHRQLRLCSMNFSYKENNLLKNILKNKFGIQARIYKQRKYVYLCLNLHELKKFIKLIKKYILPDYKYKIDVKNSLKKQKEYYIKNYEKYWSWNAYKFREAKKLEV